jgi:hypothetical protein
LCVSTVSNKAGLDFAAPGEAATLRAILAELKRP